MLPKAPPAPVMSMMTPASCNACDTQDQRSFTGVFLSTSSKASNIPINNAGKGCPTNESVSAIIPSPKGWDGYLAIDLNPMKMIGMIMGRKTTKMFALFSTICSSSFPILGVVWVSLDPNFTAQR